MHSGNYLVKLTDPNEDILNESVYIWAVKPDCSILKIEPNPGETNVFHFEILNNEQTSFDFTILYLTPERTACSSAIMRKI